MTNLPSVEEAKGLLDFVGLRIASLQPRGQSQAQDIAIDTYENIKAVLQSYLSAATELPEEKLEQVMVYHNSVDGMQICHPTADIYAEGFNACLSQSRLVVLKLKAEIAEKEKRIAEMSVNTGWGRIAEYQANIIRLEAKIYELQAQAKIPSWETLKSMASDFACRTINSIGAKISMPTLNNLANQFADELTALLAGKKG